MNDNLERTHVGKTITQDWGSMDTRDSVERKISSRHATRRMERFCFLYLGNSPEQSACFARSSSPVFDSAARRRAEIAYTLVQACSGSRGLNQINVMPENRLFSFRIHRDLKRPAELASAAKELSAL